MPTLTVLELILCAFFGACLGSFANVVIFRLPHGLSVIKPRSHCPQCKNPIKAWQNIPIFGFLILRGKCGFCAAKISWRYPLVEFIMALFFVIARLRADFDLWLFIQDFPFVWIMVTLTFIDFDHRIIPDELSLGGLVLGLLTAFIVPGRGVLDSFLGAALGFGIFFSLAWVYERLTGKMGLGGGDIKLLAMIGSFVGPWGVLAVILYSSLIGSVVGITTGVVSKLRHPAGEGELAESVLKTSIPYGPFLAAAALYVFLFGGDAWLRYMTQI